MCYNFINFFRWIFSYLTNQGRGENKGIEEQLRLQLNISKMIPGIDLQRLF
jgi:hypothetical protein